MIAGTPYPIDLKYPMPPLIFIYNGDSGFFNTVTDIAHKLFSPSTYPCKLCAMTHGVIRMDSLWREFVDAYEGDLEFLHRDQYLPRIGMLQVTLPVILERLSDSKIRVLVDSEEISAVASSKELIKLIERRVTSGDRLEASQHTKSINGDVALSVEDGPYMDETNIADGLSFIELPTVDEALQRRI